MSDNIELEAELEVESTTDNTDTEKQPEQATLPDVAESIEKESDQDKKSKESEEQVNLVINQEEFKHLKAILEALLMASDKPMSMRLLTDVLSAHNEDPNTRVRDKVKFNKKFISLAIDELMTDYEDSSIEIKLLGTGYRIQTKPIYAPWVQRLWQEKPSKYSKATLETLAIIAYRQPITRGEIEHIRGVAVSSHIIRNLLDREWIKVVGHKELPGRPAIYATTGQFLSDLNLEKLEELPTLADIKEIKQDLFSGLERGEELHRDGDKEGVDTKLNANAEDAQVEEQAKYLSEESNARNHNEVTLEQDQELSEESNQETYSETEASEAFESQHEDGVTELLKDTLEGTDADDSSIIELKITEESTL